MARLRSNPWVVLLVLCMGFFMILLDTTIVNIAIPSIVDSLNASLNQILWVLNAYILVYAVLLITAGRLGDIYGQRNLFAFGMALFVAASAFCGVAQDTNQLVAGRIVQGIGGAVLTPQTLSILTSIFPPERRGAAFGTWGAVAGIAAITGPTLGGFIVTNWTWRWIFYVNLPIGIVALIATFLIIPDLRTGRRHRLDVVGVLLASVGLLGIVFGLIEGQRHDWGPVWGWVTIPEVIAAGVLVLAGFVLWERGQAEPLIPLSLFRDRNYSVMNAVGAAMSFGMLGLFLPITIYFQSALGMSPLSAGLAVAPLSLTSMFVAPISGRLADRTGGKYIVVFGLVLYAAGMSLVALRATVDASWSSFALPFILAGLGQGCVFAPTTTVAMRHITPRMAGAASGVMNTTRQLGSVVGSAAVGALLQNQLATALRERAIADAAQLPPQLQERFVEAISSAAKGGLEVGRTQGGGAQLPPGIPPQVGAQLQQLFHDVFVNGFVVAMRPTLALSIAVLLVGAAAALAVEGRTRAAQRALVAEVARADDGRRLRLPLDGEAE